MTDEPNPDAVAAYVSQGYTRDSVIAAINAQDFSLLARESEAPSVTEEAAAPPVPTQEVPAGADPVEDAGDDHAEAAQVALDDLAKLVDVAKRLAVAAESADGAVQYLLALRQTHIMNGDEDAANEITDQLAELGLK